MFVAQAVDRDGNFDATPASLTFYVPYDLAPSQGRGWKRVKSRGSFAGDYVSTTKQGRRAHRRCGHGPSARCG